MDDDWELGPPTGRQSRLSATSPPPDAPAPQGECEWAGRIPGSLRSGDAEHCDEEHWDEPSDDGSEHGSEMTQHIRPQESVARPAAKPPRADRALPASIDDTAAFGDDDSEVAFKLSIRAAPAPSGPVVRPRAAETIFI